MAHEGVEGAHTLAKHVGKSEEYLRHRLATEPGITAASSFYDRQTAEDAISGLLRTNQRQVDRWLAGRRTWLTLSGSDSTQLGVLLARGSTEPAPAQGIKIVLLRSAKMESGYLLFTAMVTE
jgi:Bacterial CdiA-CT RNAse A domain